MFIYSKAKKTVWSYEGKQRHSGRERASGVERSEIESSCDSYLLCVLGNLLNFSGSQFINHYKWGSSYCADIFSPLFLLFFGLSKRMTSSGNSLSYLMLWR